MLEFGSNWLQATGLWRWRRLLSFVASC